MVFASKLREDGYTLNSNEVLSLIMWRLFDKGNSRLTMDKFINMLEVFKFTGVTPDNIQ